MALLEELLNLASEIKSIGKDFLSVVGEDEGETSISYLCGIVSKLRDIADDIEVAIDLMEQYDD